MPNLPTPISVIETYFGQKLTLRNISFWGEVSDDTWVDFAKSYLAQMKAGFTPEAMAERVEDQKLRLFFDFRLGEQYDSEIAKHDRYAITPLLGHSPYPSENVDYSQEGISQVLAPLAKHLLVADEIYITDNFYRCFDAVADMYDRHRWRDNPNIELGVRHSIRAILQWLPILAGLRELIISGVINFLPYYIIPSFPYVGSGPVINQQMQRLEIPWEPGVKPAGESDVDFSNWEQPGIVYKGQRTDYKAVVDAWINARLLGLDPVFANEETWRWATSIKFREETKHHLTTDLMSIDLLPLGDHGGLDAHNIVLMRKEEQVFKHIRDTLVGCKDYIRQNVSEDASRDFVSKICREYVRDHLNPNERLKTIKFLDNNLFAGTILSVAVSAAFMAANPWVGLLVPAALTPKAFLAVEAKFNPRVHAAVRLEALL